MSENNSIIYSPIPRNLLDIEQIKKTPCQFIMPTDIVQGEKVETIEVTCEMCPKTKCGLEELACAHFISKELSTNSSFRSLVIRGKKEQRSYHSDQMKRIYELVKIYKKIKIEPVQESTSVACQVCYEFLDKLFITLKTMIISDPGVLYKNREFYKAFAGNLCPSCSVPLMDFITLVEREFPVNYPEWSQFVDATTDYKIEYYVPIIESKRSDYTHLTDSNHLITISERNVNGYTIRIAQDPFSVGKTDIPDLDDMFPVSGTDFTRRQKVYAISMELPDHVNQIISKLQSFIVNDPDTKRVWNYMIRSTAARNFIKSKVRQSISSVINELGIDENLITKEEKEIIESKIVELTVGWGIWEIFLSDDNVNEIFAVSGRHVVVETYQDGKCRTNMVPSEEEFNRFIRMLTVNVREADFWNRVLEVVIDPEKDDIHFGKMRLTLFKKPLVENHAFIIRKHRHMQLSGSELILFGTMSPAMLAYCTMMKRRNKCNMIYVGDVGSGKTTVQLIVDTKVPKDSTLITIGDIVELDMGGSGFQNLTLYADRPGEEKIGQSRSTLIAKALRTKSDADQITEVLSPDDTHAWVHTWVAGKAGSVTYHAANIEKMLVRCGDELRSTGTLDPSTKMYIFQTVIASRRILSTEGYKYRVVAVEWVIDKKDPSTNLPLTLDLFKWDSDHDIHRFNAENFKEIYNSYKFKEILYSVDTVKHWELPSEMEVYEKLWRSLLNCINIYKEFGLFGHIAKGQIPHFQREIELFSDIFDAQVDMYRTKKTTDWNQLLLLGKRKIYSGLLETIKEYKPDSIEDVIRKISEYDRAEPESEFHELSMANRMENL